MKKFLCLTISLVFIICGFSACRANSKKPDLDNADKSQVLDTNSAVSEESNSDKEKTSSDSAKNNKKNEKDTNTSTTSNSSKNKSSTSTNTTSQPTQNNSSTVNTTTSSDSTPSNNQTIENIDNGVLQEATVQEMNVPENMQLLGTNNAKEENNSNNVKATVAAYKLDGDAVSWKTENDYLYIITSGNNRLVVINSKDMMPIANVPLAGKPAELNIIGAEIYISLPDLCRIDVFSKSNYTKTTSLNFEHEVSSFCIDGEYIYYSEHDQHCDVYKKNMTTNELINIIPDRGWSFYQPKLYLNKEDNILYIGETGHTGSTLFYYDATTLQLKSIFRKNDYGLFNHTRDIFHVGNEIFWANYRLSDTNANEIVGRYGEGDYGSVNFASEELVSTFEGIFLTDTYECVVNYFDARFRFEYILVTESNNIFFRARSIDKNIILGINFSMQ
ncbi:MAG: hypothetical protein IKT44_01745 [Clostridia bacterium]|nr:hypothetical protein [Clostridia bacterium]